MDVVRQGLRQGLVDQRLERNQKGRWQQRIIPIKDDAGLMRLWLRLRWKPDLFLGQLCQHVRSPRISTTRTD